MGLKISLKPNERLVINSAVITNAGNSDCAIIVENKATILRKNNIMAEKEADTPCKQLYFIIQLMYLDNENLTKHSQNFRQLSEDILKAAPSTSPYIDEIRRHVSLEKYYEGLKSTKKLIDYEKELLTAQPPSDIQH